MAPKAVWAKIWSSTPTQRLTREIRRRTDVEGIFPNHDAVTRLAGVVLAEQHDEWIQENLYMSVTVLEMTTAVMNADIIDDTTNTKKIPA